MWTRPPFWRKNPPLSPFETADFLPSSRAWKSTFSIVSNEGVQAVAGSSGTKTHAYSVSAPKMPRRSFRGEEGSGSGDCRDGLGLTAQVLSAGGSQLELGKWLRLAPIYPMKTRPHRRRTSLRVAGERRN